MAEHHPCLHTHTHKDTQTDTDTDTNTDTDTDTDTDTCESLRSIDGTSPVPAGTRGTKPAPFIDGSEFLTATILRRVTEKSQ